MLPACLSAFSTRLALGVVLALPTAVSMVAQPANAQVVQLTQDEAAALKLRLIEAKPNVATVTIASFFFPGSAQAYMGYTDRTVLMWGIYTAAFIGVKAAIPDSTKAGPAAVSDLVAVGMLMSMATWSAIDAFLLSQERRTAYDVMINRLTERSMGLAPGALAPVVPVVPSQPNPAPVYQPTNSF